MFTGRRFFLAISIIIFLIFVFIFWKYSIDDAFITFRYAENFANGNGLTFNPGDKPVEGYSNFLLLLMLAGFYKLGLPTYLTSKIVGIISFLISGILWYWFFNKEKSEYLWMTGPLYLICPITAFWAVSGLELGLHALLIAALMVALLKQSKLIFLPLPLFILNRPESFILAISLIMIAGIYDFSIRRLNRKYYFMALLTILFSSAILFGFRLEYFGYFLPNTYYAKLYHDILWGYEELGRMLVIFLTMTLLFLYWAARSIFLRSCEKPLFIFGLIFLFQAIISASVDPIMNFQFRYMIPFLPLLLAISLNVVPIFGKPIYSGIGIVLIGISLMLSLPKILDRIAQESEIMKSQQEFIELASSFPKGTTISMTDVGRIPYYTNNIYYDLWGLVNEETAHLGFDPEREFLRMPDYFVMVGYLIENRLNLRFDRDRLVAKLEAFPDAYEFRTICLPKGKSPAKPGYYYMVFRRKPDAWQKYKGIDLTI